MDGVRVMANCNNVNRNERNRGMLNLEIVWFGIYLSEDLRNKNSTERILMHICISHKAENIKRKTAFFS